MAAPDVGHDGPADTVASGKSAWQRPESGGRFAIWLIRSIGLYGGRRLARLLLYPITLYFYLRRGPERRAIRGYLQRLDGRPVSSWRVMRVIFKFSATLLDRVFFLGRGSGGFELDAAGEAQLHALLAEGRGALLIGSHFGSFEALRALSIDHGSTPLRIVLDKQQTPQLTRLLEELAPGLSRAVVDLSRGGPEATLAMAEALRAGHMVGLLADRARPGEQCVAVPFLGAPAPFPVTPWRLAAALDAPVVLCFGAYLGGNRYRLMFEHFSDGITLDRARREADLHAIIAGYAARLEQRVRAYPYNWFNFYDFWRTDAEHAAPARRTPRVPRKIAGRH